MPDTQITIRCSDEFRKRLVAHARNKNTTVSEVGRLLFDMFLRDEITIHNTPTVKFNSNNGKQAT